MLLVTPELSERTNLNPLDTNLNPLDIGLSPVSSSSCGLVQLTSTNVSDRRHRDTWPFHRAHASLGRCAVHAEGRAGILLLTFYRTHASLGRCAVHAEGRAARLSKKINPPPPPPQKYSLLWLYVGNVLGP